MKNHAAKMLCLLLAGLMGLPWVGAALADDEARGGGTVRLVSTIPVTGTPTNASGKMFVFDISWVDAATQRYYLADRSNAAIDIVDAKKDVLITQIQAGFAGFTGSNDTSGPNGVVVFGRPGNQFLIATDANSRVVSINLQTGTVVNEVSTGGTPGLRADELAYDPEDSIVMPVNNADTPPFATLIKVNPQTGMLTQPANVEGVDRVTFTDATNGAEQPQWDPRLHRFLISIPEVNGPGGTGPDGAVKVINPHTATVEKMFAVHFCQPAGLTLGPRNDVLLGCSVIFNTAGTAWTGLTDPNTAAPIQAILDVKSGHVEAVAGVGGSDEVWFNPGDGRYYTASRANPGAVPNGSNPPTDPVLGVIDADSLRLLQLVPTFNTPNPTSPPPRGTAHSVAANPRNNQVFVPLPANNVFPNCLTGCIAVYAAPGGNDDK
ncbi:MAG TPA: hypothetical protein VGM22_12230 [Methylomirabilota bacterium]